MDHKESFRNFKVLTRKSFILENHCLGACFNPYNAFCSLHTWSGRVEFYAAFWLLHIYVLLKVPVKKCCFNIHLVTM